VDWTDVEALYEGYGLTRLRRARLHAWRYRLRRGQAKKKWCKATTTSLVADPEEDDRAAAWNRSVRSWGHSCRWRSRFEAIRLKTNVIDVPCRL